MTGQYSVNEAVVYKARSGWNIEAHCSLASHVYTTMTTISLYLSTYLFIFLVSYLSTYLSVNLHIYPVQQRDDFEPRNVYVMRVRYDKVQRRDANAHRWPMRCGFGLFAAEF